MPQAGTIKSKAPDSSQESTGHGCPMDCKEISRWQAQNPPVSMCWQPTFGNRGSRKTRKGVGLMLRLPMEFLPPAFKNLKDLQYVYYKKKG